MADLSNISTEELLRMRGGEAPVNPPSPPNMGPEQPEPPGFLEQANQLAKGMPQNRALGYINEQLGRAPKKLESVAYEAGGKVTDLATPIVGTDVAPALGYATNVGIQALPVILGAAGGKAVGQEPAEKAARKLMASSLKPTAKAWRTGKADQAITTMLDEGVSATRGGLSKVEGELSKLDDALEKIIAGSTNNVDTYRAATRIRGLLDDVRNQVNPNADVAAVLRSVDEFINNPLVQQYIPVQVAQQLKRGTYASLGSKAYGEVQTASAEAQKQLARGLKEEIAAVEPGVSPINERMTKLLDVEEILAPRIAMDMNRNPLGLGGLTPSVKNLAVWLADRNAAVKSMLARGLHQGSGVLPTSAGAALGIGPAQWMGKTPLPVQAAPQQSSEAPSFMEQAANALVPAAEAASPNEQQQRTWQIVSNLHGPIGTFDSLQQARGYAKNMGIQISPVGTAGTGYFIKAVPIKKPSPGG